jgi:transcriptional regulator with XRE-family HTH domain
MMAKQLPPKKPPAAPPKPGIAAQVRDARTARRLTWYALAKLAGIPNQATIRAIEQGKDVRLSNVERVAQALGLTLELRGKIGTGAN